jgi:3-oxoacyl-[acyl-carrier-protein] synthase II
MIGHALGAAGSIELIASVLTIKNQFIPPTINYEFPDPECDLDYVPNKGRKASVTTVLKNSFGFGGKNSNIIIRKYDK